MCLSMNFYIDKEDNYYRHIIIHKSSAIFIMHVHDVLHVHM